MFRNSLENLGKCTGESKNNYSGKFPKFLKIFANLRRSPEIFETHLKSSEKKIGIFRKMLKATFKHFKTFYEIFRNHRKSSEVSVRLWETSERFGNLSQSA